MTDRNQQIAEFLNRAGWGDAERRLLAADASFRRYDRLVREGGSAVLMDAPPPQEDVRPFNSVQNLLLELGFSAPRPLDIDEEQGFLLLEDLGDRTFTRALKEGEEESPLYCLAIDLLVALHRRWATGPLPRAAQELPPYDDKRLLNEALLLTDWYLPALRGAPLDASHRERYVALWREVLELARDVPQGLVLRDYHVDNLMILSGREGIAACGLLDFQDAVLGPVTYDLVSLLEDARRDLRPGLSEDMLQRYLQAFPDLDRERFHASYAVLGAQRNAKIIGIFTRLSRRDAKPDYLQHIPRVWRLLEGDLKHPALGALREWFNEVLPAPARVVPKHRPLGARET